MRPMFSRLIRSVALAVTLALAGCSLSPSHSAYRPIHGYARAGDLARLTEDLAENPGDLNLPDDTGLTPLHLAASYCHADVVTLLLDKGAKINVTSQDGATPLHLAAQEGCADVANLLLQRGANVNARDKQHRTPLGRAIQWRQTAMVLLIRQHGGAE